MVGPDYERPQTPLPATYPDEPAASAAPAPIRADWWTLYNDPTLNSLVATALSDNLDVAFAVARIEEADADLVEANASLFPEIDLRGRRRARSRSSGSVTTPVPIRLSNDLRVALSTSFEIDFWGRLRRMVESARAQALATHYAKDVVTLSLAGLTTQTYFALRSLDAQITATRETLATREDYLDIVRRRVDSGLASDLDLNQALGARSDAAAQLKELVRQRAIAEHLLGTLTGTLDLKLRAGRSGAAAGAAGAADRAAVVAAGAASGHSRRRGKPGLRQRARSAWPRRRCYRRSRLSDSSVARARI